MIITMTLPTDLAEATYKKVDTTYNKITDKIEYIFHKTDGTTVLKTSDRPAISESGLTVTFDA